MTERIYSCLICPHRPVFHGKVRAYLHVREAHEALLAQHHADELLQEGAECDEPDVDHYNADDRGPPYVCLCESETAHGRCQDKRTQSESMVTHLVGSHGIPAALAKVGYGELYLSECALGDYEAEQMRLREEAGEPSVRQFVRVLDTCVGVGDFLTECRA